VVEEQGGARGAKEMSESQRYAEVHVRFDGSPPEPDWQLRLEPSGHIKIIRLDKIIASGEKDFTPTVETALEELFSRIRRHLGLEEKDR